MSSNEDFKKRIKRIVDLDDEEKKLKDELNKIKNEKEMISNDILNFMETNNITGKDIIYGKNKIKYVKLKNIENITKNLIYNKLKIYLRSESAAAEATEFIYSDRKSEYKTQIKISDIKIKERNTSE